jgi:anti-anti-sigma factor
MSVTSAQIPSPAPLRIKSRWLSPDVVQIAVDGEIDLATTEQLQADLLDVISAGLAHRVEVDLAGVSFMDCTGLGVLVVARGAAARAGCSLQITRPQPVVRRILELTGLLAVLTTAGQNTEPGRPPLFLRRPARMERQTSTA